MKKDYESELKKSGLKATTPRISILSVFTKDCNPMDALGVYEKVKSNKIDLVTVYRTLASFELSKIIKRVDLRKDSVYFELANNHHHHIICKRCGIFEEFDGCSLDTLAKKIHSKLFKNKNINEHSFEFFGLCNTCVKR